MVPITVQVNQEYEPHLVSGLMVKVLMDGFKLYMAKTCCANTYVHMPTVPGLGSAASLRASVRIGSGLGIVTTLMSGASSNFLSNTRLHNYIIWSRKVGFLVGISYHNKYGVLLNNCSEVHICCTTVPNTWRSYPLNTVFYHVCVYAYRYKLHRLIRLALPKDDEASTGYL